MTTLMSTTFFTFGKTLLAKSAAIKGFIVRKGESRFGSSTPFQGINPNDLKISATDTAGMISMFEYTGNAKTGPPLHIHKDQDEIFYIAEGEYLFQLGDEKFKAIAGDTIFGVRNVPHTWIQLSPKGKIVYLVQPAGKMEEFFSKINELKGPLSDELAKKIHHDHGMEVLGPPLIIN